MFLIVSITQQKNLRLNSAGFSVNGYFRGRRRPTLPSALLEEAGIAMGPRDIVARVDGPGRVVLEDPTTLLADLQKSVATSKLEKKIRGSLVNRLLKDRQNDKSLR